MVRYHIFWEKIPVFPIPIVCIKLATGFSFGGQIYPLWDEPQEWPLVACWIMTTKEWHKDTMVTSQSSILNKSTTISHLQQHSHNCFYVPASVVYQPPSTRLKKWCKHCQHSITTPPRWSQEGESKCTIGLRPKLITPKIFLLVVDCCVGLLYW